MTLTICGIPELTSFAMVQTNISKVNNSTPSIVSRCVISHSLASRLFRSFSKVSSTTRTGIRFYCSISCNLQVKNRVCFMRILKCLRPIPSPIFKNKWKVFIQIQVRPMRLTIYGMPELTSFAMVQTNILVVYNSTPSIPSRCVSSHILAPRLFRPFSKVSSTPRTGLRFH